MTYRMLPISGCKQCIFFQYAEFGDGNTYAVCLFEYKVSNLGKKAVIDDHVFLPFCPLKYVEEVEGVDIVAIHNRMKED